MIRGFLSTSTHQAGPAANQIKRCTNLLLRGGVSFSTQTSSSYESGSLQQNNVLDVESPFPPIGKYNHLPITEFVTAEWAHRNKNAIVDGHTGQTRTFKQYHRAMGAIAANLKDEFGIQHDSTVALFAPNHVDYIPIVLATTLCGAKLTPINPQYKSKELSTILNLSKSSVLIVHHNLLDVALEAVKDSESVKHIIAIPEDDGVPVLDGMISLTSLKQHAKPVYDSHPNTFQNPSSYPCLLPYSSGTTGLPKGVVLSHSNLVANLLQLETLEGLALPSNSTLISPLPFFHIYGFLASLLYAAWQGQQLITMSGRFDLELFCQLVEKHQPQRAHLVPPIIVGLAKHPVIDKYDLTSLSMIVSAAAPLSSDIENETKTRIGVDIKQAWGMTELSPLATIISDYNMKSGSVGQLVPNTIGRIVDPETNMTLGPGETGELLVKGPQLMMGYYNEPVKTADCLSPDGFLKTGDIAYYDDDGFFYIRDRIKELIKVRGFQVAPAELEALLLTHPNIADVAVIGIEDDLSGELPRAYVVLKKDEHAQKINEEDVKDWVRERVAPFKRMEGGVVFIEQVPKSASGKLLRRILKDQYKENSKSSRD